MGERINLPAHGYGLHLPGKGGQGPRPNGGHQTGVTQEGGSGGGGIGHGNGCVLSKTEKDGQKGTIRAGKNTWRSAITPIKTPYGPETLPAAAMPWGMDRAEKTAFPPMITLGWVDLLS